MTKNKNKFSVVSIYVLLIALLAGTIIYYSTDKFNYFRTITELNKKIENLKGKVSYYERYKNNEKKRLSLYYFKENIFRLKYPKFSSTVKIVYKKSKEYGFNPYLIMAIIQVESAFNPYAISSAGAYGLMQVNYSVWKNELKIDFNKIFNQEYNIDLGLKILKHYYETASGNMFLALFRYNNGYKYDNTGYNGKIIATRFYENRKKAHKKPAQENLSI